MSVAIFKRYCRNCTGPIPRPTNNNLKKRVFCSDNCRKEFHRNQGVSVHKLKVQVLEWVTAATKPLQQSLDDLLNRLIALENRRPVAVALDSTGRKITR